MRVRELMVPEPECAPAWRPVGEFIATVATRSRQRVFPVTGFDGRPCGASSPSTACHGSRRGTPATASTRWRSPFPRPTPRAPDDPVASLVERMPLAGALLAVVVTDGRVVGMVTVDDLGRLIQQSMLRARSSPSPTSPVD